MHFIKVRTSKFKRNKITLRLVKYLIKNISLQG